MSFQNSFIFSYNVIQTNNSIFFSNKTGENFHLAKKSPTLSKIPLAGRHLFIGVGHLFNRRQVNTSYKMNEVVNRFLLAGYIYA